MDKETLSNYGWVVIVVIVLAIMITLATPFGNFIGNGVNNILNSFNAKVNTEGSDDEFIMLDADTEFYQLMPTDMKYRSSAPSETLTEVQVDGNVVDETNYTTETGSTIIILDKSYVTTLTPEKHTITIISGNSSVATEFEVKEGVPETASSEVTNNVPVTGNKFTYGDYGYTYSGTEWIANTIDKTKTSYGELLNTIYNKKVTSLYNTFCNCTALVEAPIIPDGVINMDHAFSGCTSLTTAPVIPSSVTRMVSTFTGCTSLTTAPVIPNSVTAMGGAFSGCTKLTTVSSLPNNIKGIESVFQNCKSLVNAPAIPNGVTTMDYAFKGCTSLTTAPVIPSSVIIITNAFSGCTSLTTAPVIPSSVKNMSNVFSGCTSLTGTITNNATITSISYASYVFDGTVKTIDIIGSCACNNTIAGKYNNVTFNGAN